MQKKTSMLKKVTMVILSAILILLIGIIVIVYIGTSQNNARMEADQVAQMNIRINKQFSEWDGSHNNLVMLVKANMNDASSFEHVYTEKAKFTGDSLRVVMQYRGKNAFGAKVLEQVTAITDLDGRILSIQKN